MLAMISGGPMNAIRQRSARCRLARGALGLALLGSLVLPAQLAGQRSARPIVNQEPEGFFFRRPVFSLALRAGANFRDTDSRIFGFFTEQLTLERGDFDGPAVAAELGVSHSDRWEVVLGIAHAQRETASEFRNYVDSQGRPITQSTLLSSTPLTVAARFYLLSRGRQIGRFVWIPARLAPYLGAGVGFTHYLLRQAGSFVDPSDLSIFSDRFESQDWSPLAVLLAGVDYGLSRRVLLNADARYHFANGDVGGDFQGFRDGISLSGLQLTAGLKFRW